MRQMGVLATDLPVHLPGFRSSLANQSSNSGSSPCSLQRRDLKSLLGFTLRLAGGSNGSKLGLRLPVTSKLSSPLGEGWLWRTSSNLRFAAPGSRSLGQLAFLLDAVKNSALCQQCHTKLPTGALACLSSTVNTFGGGGGRGFAGKGGGGGGGGGGDGFGAAASKGAALSGEQSDDVPVGAEAGDDVLILDVGGMSCGGCSAAVKRILESQPQVSLANVNLATETAFVQVVRGAQPPPEWTSAKQEIGEALAKHLSNCGYKSTLRETVV